MSTAPIAGPAANLPLLPMLNLGRHVAARLGPLTASNPDLGLQTVEALLALGLTAFDRVQWTPLSPQELAEQHTARPPLQDRSIWSCAQDGALAHGGPTPALERLAQALDQRLAQDPDHALAVALGHWFDDDWGVVTMLIANRPHGEALARWTLQRAMSSVRHAPGPWPAEAMRTRCRDVLSPHPHAARLPEAWQDPTGRALVQGLMLWTTRIKDPEKVCRLLEIAQDVGVPLLAWAARWHHQNPDAPSRGLGTRSAPFLMHLALMDRWTVVQWWRDHALEDPPWTTALMRHHHPSQAGREETVNLAQIAGMQALGQLASLGIYHDANASEARLAVLTDVLRASMQGDRNAQAVLDQGLHAALLDGLTNGRLQDGTAEQQQALLTLLVEHDQARLRHVLPPNTVPSAPSAASRRRL